MRQKAGWLGDLAKRFVHFMKHCTPDVFVMMSQVYHDLLGTERRLNVIVELFRTNDVTETSCLHELHRIISQLEHLTEAYLGQYGESSHAEQFFALTRALDFNADRMTVEFTYIQQLVEKANKVEDIPVAEGSVCLDVDYLEPLTRLIVQAKSSKISAKKLLRRLEELSEEALTLKVDHLHRFKTLYSISSKICNFCYDLCHQVTVYVDAKCGSREAISIKEIQHIVREKADEILDLPESTLWEASLKILKSLTSELANTLTRVENDHKKDKIVTSVSPWIQRASDMKAEVMVNHDLERKLQQHNDEIIRLIKDVKLKDQSLQEASVKVDLLERRMEFAKKESEQISQLERALEKAHDQEQMYAEAMDSLQAEYDLLEQENIQLKKQAAKKEENRQSLLKKINCDDMYFTATDVPDDSSSGYKAMNSHMKTLKAAIRYLRSENAQLKCQDLANSLSIQQLPSITQHENSNNDNMERAQHIQSMATQTRNLLKDVRMASACPKLVELSQDSSIKQWQSVKKSPTYQFQAQQSVLYTLRKRTQQLQQNIQAIVHEQDGSSPSSSITTAAKVMTITIYILLEFY
ncbi:dynein associated protein-domain-containing protein [Absidia repens]|uniref:Dynein associated protein-domain-containing protein n=1 Tax=Absidia repens TaxID=90262 RepID=A0A1X2IKA7_9FUNG|nr:dynein associated protein-domain-containing protein [Absidia repens]